MVEAAFNTWAVSSIGLCGGHVAAVVDRCSAERQDTVGCCCVVATRAQGHIAQAPLQGLRLRQPQVHCVMNGAAVLLSFL